MNRLYIYAVALLIASSLSAMEQANEVFKNMIGINMNAILRNVTRYTACTPGGKKLHALSWDFNEKLFSVVLEDEKGNQTVLNRLMQENERKQIFNFLSYTFVKKNMEHLCNKDIVQTTGYELVEPQEMPRDCNKKLLDAHLEAKQKPSPKIDSYFNVD